MKNETANKTVLRFAMQISSVFLLCTAVLFFILAALVGLGERPRESSSTSVDSTSPNEKESMDSAVEVTASGMISDFDRSPKIWWMTDPHAVLRLSNRRAVKVNVRLSIDFHRSPCQFPVVYQMSQNFSLTTVDLSVDDQESAILDIQMDPSTTAQIPVKSLGAMCALPSDPRVFFGRLDTEVSIKSNEN
jgi:hypothetical protein